VHRRAEADKATELVKLHRVSSMLAAGWGATAKVKQLSIASYSLPSPPMSFSLDPMSSLDDMDDGIASSARQARESVANLPELASLQELADAVAEHLSRGGQLAGLPTHCSAFALHGSVTEAIARVAGSGIDESQFWLLLAHWVNDRDDGANAAWIDELLAPFLETFDHVAVTSALQILDDVLGHVSLDAWPEKRSQRLRDALARSQRG
jgi:hypothetical protein